MSQGWRSESSRRHRSPTRSRPRAGGSSRESGLSEHRGRYRASPASYRSFCDAYGADLMTWDGAEALCRTFELLLLSWVIASWDISPQMEAEAALRLASFRGETDQPWTLL